MFAWLSSVLAWLSSGLAWPFSEFSWLIFESVESNLQDCWAIVLLQRRLNEVAKSFLFWSNRATGPCSWECFALEALMGLNNNDLYQRKTMNLSTWKFACFILECWTVAFCRTSSTCSKGKGHHNCFKFSWASFFFPLETKTVVTVSV